MNLLVVMKKILVILIILLVYLKITGKGTSPTLNISTNDLNFGTCKLNEKKDIFF